MRVIFCGKNFDSGFNYTSKAVKCYLNSIGRSQSDIEVLQVDDKDLPEEIRHADVLIPFMTRISNELISRAIQLKLIMQFGVGLEGVDVSAA